MARNKPNIPLITVERPYEPGEKLASEMIIQALYDLKFNPRRIKVNKTDIEIAWMNKRNARRWIFNDMHECAMPFSMCCDVLNVGPDVVRNGIIKMAGLKKSLDMIKKEYLF